MKKARHTDIHRNHVIEYYKDDKFILRKSNGWGPIIFPKMVDTPKTFVDREALGDAIAKHFGLRKAEKCTK